MIGPNVQLVRLLGTMVLRSVGNATAVLVGCFSDVDNEPTPVQRLGGIR